MDIDLYFVISKNLTDTSNKQHLSQLLHDTNVVYIPYTDVSSALPLIEFVSYR